MKIILAFLMSLLFLGNLSAKEKDEDEYKHYSSLKKDFVYLGEYSISYKYFAHLFMNLDDSTYRCFLVYLKHSKYHICCELDSEIAFFCFPFLKEMPEKFAGPKVDDFPDDRYPTASP